MDYCHPSLIRLMLHYPAPFPMPCPTPDSEKDKKPLAITSIIQPFLGIFTAQMITHRIQNNQHLYLTFAVAKLFQLQFSSQFDGRRIGFVPISRIEEPLL